MEKKENAFLQYLKERSMSFALMYHHLIFMGKLLKVFGSNEHVGRSALQTYAPRNATLTTSFESHILKLQRWDFQQCLNNLFKIERPKWKKFVEIIHFFDSFHPHKIERICNELKGRFMSTKECLHSQYIMFFYLFLQFSVFYNDSFKHIKNESDYLYDSVDNFYIMNNRTLVKDVVVDLEESNRWPIGAKEWEKKQSLLVKEYLYNIKFNLYQDILKLQHLNNFNYKKEQKLQMLQKIHLSYLFQKLYSEKLLVLMIKEIQRFIYQIISTQL